MSVIHIDKNNFKNEVLNSDKKVLLDFWAPWCGPCRMIAPILEEIARDMPDVKVAKVNVDEEAELSASFEIVSIPTLLVFENGKIVNKLVGFRPKESIEEILE